MKVFLLSVAAVLLAAHHADGYIPPVIQRCPRNHPNPGKCISESVDKLRPNLAAGDFGPNFNVPSLEPLYINRMDMNRGKDFSLSVSDVYASGGSKFVIEAVKETNIPNLTFDFVLNIPKLDFHGQYRLNMRLALLDIRGVGPFQGTINNVRVRVRLRGHTDPNGHVQFKRIGVKIAAPTKDAHFNLENLFDGDKTLGTVGNQVINDNVDIFITEMIPGLETNLSRIFTEIINSILATTTFDEMFPPQ